MKEINIPNGYTNHITIDENGNIVVTNTHVSATVYPPDDSFHNNMHTANTGDASNNFIWVLMLVASVSGAVSILFVKEIAIDKRQNKPFILYDIIKNSIYFKTAANINKKLVQTVCFVRAFSIYTALYLSVYKK